MDAYFRHEPVVIETMAQALQSPPGARAHVVAEGLMAYATDYEEPGGGTWWVESLVVTGKTSGKLYGVSADDRAEIESKLVERVRELQEQDVALSGTARSNTTGH